MFARVAAGAATCQPNATTATTTSLISRFIPFPLAENRRWNSWASLPTAPTVIAPRYPEVITGLGVFPPPRLLSERLDRLEAGGQGRAPRRPSRPAVMRLAQP